MKQSIRASRARLILVAFGLVFAIGAATSTASAQGGGSSSITIHNRLCPGEYDGSDYFGDCHDNPQDANLDFFIDGPVSDSAPTDDDGNVTFVDLPAGTYDISGGVPGEFADTFVYCSNNDDQDEVFVQSTEPVVSLDLPADTDVTCDWYNTPLDLSGDDDDDDDDTTLPSTGIGPVGSAGGPETFFLMMGALVVAGCGLALRMRRI